jgi:hypothetical protein
MKLGKITALSRFCNIKLYNSKKKLKEFLRKKPVSEVDRIFAPYSMPSRVPNSNKTFFKS